MAPSRARIPLLLCFVAGLLLLNAPGVRSQEDEPLTVDRVLSLLKTGTPADELIERVRDEEGAFDLTIEDVARLRAAGAPAELIRLMARGGAGAETGPAAARTSPPPRGTLTLKRVIRMYHDAVPPDAIAAQVARDGLKEPPDLEVLLAYRAEGVPDRIIRALAMGRTEAPKPAAATPLSAAAVVGMLQEARPSAAIEAEIRARGMASPPTLDEVLALRKAGASDAILAAVNEMSPGAPEEAEPEPEQPGRETPDSVWETDDQEDMAWETDSEGQAAGAVEPIPPLAPPAAGEDRVHISSVPPGARVYIAPSRTRLTEAYRHDYFAGRTPLSLSLPPGDYRVTVQKDAAGFEAGLVPAWRTLHDGAATRSLLDNADLTFDPADCCLPGSLSGKVEVRSVPGDLPKGIIGDTFDGLPPYLFDGETLQILSVRKAHVRRAMKVYELRKHPGQSRLLVAAFVPAQGDSLDPESMPGLPPGTPFDAYVDAPAVDFLTRAQELPALASALGVQTDHLDDAVEMLRRAGKAILQLQAEGGVRLVTLALDEDGRLRLTDATVRPADPFAPPPDKPKKKRKTVTPPVVPALPQMEREVIPGLGLPRLTIENTSSKGLGLLLDNGIFCFVPAKSKREFVVDPGTFEGRVLGGDAGTAGAKGPVHFSYHARYAMAF